MHVKLLQWPLATDSFPRLSSTLFCWVRCVLGASFWSTTSNASLGKRIQCVIRRGPLVGEREVACSQPDIWRHRKNEGQTGCQQRRIHGPHKSKSHAVCQLLNCRMCPRPAQLILWTCPEEYSEDQYPVMTPIGDPDTFRQGNESANGRWMLLLRRKRDCFVSPHPSLRTAVEPG